MGYVLSLPPGKVAMGRMRGGVWADRKRSISADSALISRLRRQLLPMEKPLDAYRQEAYAASAPFSRDVGQILTVASSKPGTLVRSWPHICSLVMTAWTSVGTSSFLCSL